MTEDTEAQPDYDDGRKPGEWRSRFDRAAWCQILSEFFLLLIYLIIPSIILFDSIVEHPAEMVRDGLLYSSFLGVHIQESNAKWLALTIAGFIGGTVFDLKWLYHSVAKGIWNRDRCLWRIIVPFNSAMVSLFTGFLFASGVIPFLKNESFDDVLALLGFGFVFGYFSDNILAALQNLARQIFGTLNDS